MSLVGNVGFDTLKTLNPTFKSTGKVACLYICPSEEGDSVKIIKTPKGDIKETALVLKEFNGTNISKVSQLTRIYTEGMLILMKTNHNLIFREDVYKALSEACKFDAIYIQRDKSYLGMKSEQHIPGIKTKITLSLVSKEDYSGLVKELNNHAKEIMKK